MEINKKELEALKVIRNWLVHKGTTPSVRELMNELHYKSSYSAVLIINRLLEAGYLRKRDGKLILVRDFEGNRRNVTTIKVPLVGNAPCGAPIMAHENVESYITISTGIAKPPHKYFLLRAIGNSMNKRNIVDGDLVLVRQQETAEPGEIVVALVDGESTIKELGKSEGLIVLKPCSTEKKHQPIIVGEDFRVQGIVIATIKNI